MRSLQKLLVSVVIVAVCLIPLWLFLGARSLFEPNGFWQNLALTGIGLFALGGVQFLLVCLLVALLISLWQHKGPVF